MSRYSTPAAFRQALEERLRSIDAAPIDTKRTLLALQRFLVRVRAIREGVLLKGGLGLKLRFAGARATKDLDLQMSGERVPDERILVAAAALDLSDFFTYSVTFKNGLTGTRGHRFQARCQIAGRPFATFDIDAAGEEPLCGSPELLPGADWLGFNEIETPSFLVYPLASQIAEKLHALTLPRDRPNSRTRDLPDLAVLGTCADGLLRDLLNQALRLTFEHRATHTIPPEVPKPSHEWEQPYRELALAHALAWPTLQAAHAAASRFLSPVLNGTAARRWSSRAWAWGE